MNGVEGRTGRKSLQKQNRTSSSSADHHHHQPHPPLKDGRVSDPNHVRRPSSASSTAFARSPKAISAERSVKRLRLSKALTIPDSTTVFEAARRMSARKVDAALLTDSNALLSGIITDKDIAKRVIAEGLKPAETVVSKVMTKNPVFVLADTSAVDALTKMVQGKFRHLPIVENGEVIALLDIAKCLYDAIARMERAAEKGNAIVAAVEGVEKEWGSTISVPTPFIETLRERMFQPSVATVVADNPMLAKVLPSDSVYKATKKMQEIGVNAAIAVVDNKPRGILTPKDILMRVVAPSLNPESITVEKVMTLKPECITIDTPIIDALHVMHDGKFLHLPIVDKGGFVVACIDVLQTTHAAIATAEIHSLLQASNHMNQVGNAGMSGLDGVNTMMQKFWDSALALDPIDDHDDSHSDASARLNSEASESGKAAHALSGGGNIFGFKLEDRKGRVHRFSCGVDNLQDLITIIKQRIGEEVDPTRMPQLLYNDDEGDQVLLTTDGDLLAAVNYARSAGLKALRLHFDYSNASSIEEKEIKSFAIPEPVVSNDLSLVQTERRQTSYTTAVAGAAIIAGIGVLAFLKRSSI